MFLLSAVSDAFSNPDSPWYYVVGSAFLVLILAALALYVILSKRKSKRDASDPERSVSGDEIENTVPPVDGENTENKPEQAAEQSENIEKPEQQEKEDEKQEVKEEAQKEQATKEEKREQPAEKTEEQEQKEEATQAVEDEPKAESKAPAEKPAGTAKKATTAAGSAKKTAKPASTKKKPAQKAFIDRLIAATEAHAVYNELKNTILSYPGIKAKLTKDDELFMFGEEKKAKISLNGKSVELYLSVESVPAQFAVKKVDGDLPVMLPVAENDVDDAQKLIVFAMNVSMLTRNEKRRRVDYVQNAIKAKDRANNKG